MNERHYTSEQLNRLMDGRMSREEEQNLRSHLVVCNECRIAFENLGQIDASLRQVPVMHTRSDFTRIVMERVLAPAKSPLAFRLLERVSYVFGLLIVLGVMISVFVFTGVFDTQQIDTTKSVAGGIADKVGESLTSSVGVFTKLLTEYLPFAFGKGSMGIALFVAVVIVMLAAVDKFVGRRILQRR